ncbi:cold-shock protein [Segeticoccus rhizosphaerae]|jgi:2-phospho-L-lactate guanylyltransferase|uniref:cold-shock protein n=1 Tax=Segeticoccus rhizosphaerae TaxID=1104777 RepID=UPI0010BF7AA5|nr:MULTISPECIES: cold-shock protein [Intrasporangiaceae]
MQASVHHFDPSTGSGSVLLDDGREVPFDTDVFARSGLRHLRTGQRVSVVLGEGALTRLWIRGIGDGEAIR